MKGIKTLGRLCVIALIAAIFSCKTGSNAVGSGATAMTGHWVGSITTNATSAPVFGFQLPAGSTFGDYDRIVFKFKINPNSQNMNGRMRAWGSYRMDEFTFDPNGNGLTRPGMGNDGSFSAGGRLLNEAGEAYYESITEWTTQTIQLGSREKNADAAQIKAADGIVLVAFGLIAQAGGSGSRSYYVKDIALSNADGTKKAAALRPDDKKLWNGKGASAYVAQSNETVTRAILPYEEDDEDNLSAAITITDIQNQYVRGFGGMSNAFGYGGDAQYITMDDIETAYNPTTGLGLNILRIRIFTTPLAQLITQTEMNHNTTYLQAVKKVNQYGGYVLASPWSPPANYKTNNSVNGGGALKADMYDDYAAYLRNFAGQMAAQGAPVYAISVQNEPDYKVSYDGMEFTAEEHRNFLRDYGNFTRSPSNVSGYGGGAAQPYVKVVSGEAFQIGAWYFSAMDAVLSNPAALANTDIVGYHPYGGFGNKNTVTRNGALAKEHWMTEYNDHEPNAAGYAAENYATWDYVWRFADTVHHVIGINNSSAYIWWYIKRFYGLIGDGINGSANGAVMPRGYVLSHYAKYATDTVRVNTTGGRGHITLTAFQRKKTKTTAADKQVKANEDSYSVVMYDKRTTAGNPTTVRINLPAGFTAASVSGIISDSAGNRHAPLTVALNPGGNSADITLPRNAIVSVKFGR